MFRYALFILLALAGLLVQATVLSRISADALKPDLAFLVVVYLLLRNLERQGLARHARL